jgi:hypothetical protein
MARTRYRWDVETQKLVEIGSDYVPPVRGEISVDRHYENLSLQDGTVVNSRRQHQEYMRSRGLAIAADFKGAWAKQAEEREKVRTGQHDTKARREAIGRATYELEKRRSR